MSDNKNNNSQIKATFEHIETNERHRDNDRRRDDHRDQKAKIAEIVNEFSKTDGLRNATISSLARILPGHTYPPSHGTLTDADGTVFYFQGSGTEPRWDDLFVGMKVTFAGVCKPFTWSPQELPVAFYIQDLLRPSNLSVSI